LTTYPLQTIVLFGAIEGRPTNGIEGLERYLGSENFRVPYCVACGLAFTWSSTRVLPLSWTRTAQLSRQRWWSPDFYSKAKVRKADKVTKESCKSSHRCYPTLNHSSMRRNS